MQKSFKSFTQYITEAKKEITITFGRLNPPTMGHGKLLDSVARVASGGPYRIYLSQSQDPKKNPLDYRTKVKYVRKMFPKHARSVVMDTKIRNIFDVLTKLYEEGYNQVNMVVGSDRVGDFERITNKYNGVKGRHGFYNFQGGVNIVSAGERDPDAEGVSGMSASKLRQAAASNDLQSFMKGMPSGFDDAKDLFNDVRKGMGLNESHDFRTHIQLQSVSEDREAYVSGNLFSEGDSVVITNTEEVGTISFLGANYVIVETTEGKKYRKWISDVERLEESVPTITFNPVIDRAIDSIVHKKKYSNAVKAYLKTKKDLRKIAQIYDLDYRILKKNVDKILNEETLRLLGEGENLDRVRQEYEEAKDDLEDEFEGKLEDARRRDEIEAEQEEREQQDEDAVKDVEGDQPEQYYKGVDKDDKESRAKHFKRGKKLSDDDPAAYKPAPGDKDAETKPSKYTKKYDKIYGEESMKSFTDFMFENWSQEYKDSIDCSNPKGFSQRAYCQGQRKKNEETLYEDSNIDKALKNKSDESGAPKSILKDVYDRGVAAWRTGHRPGTTPSQWGLARVNSFLTYGKTAKTADKDLFEKLPDDIQSKIKNA
jgi:hypothetical protein